jgi:hypothetical protein
MVKDAAKMDDAQIPYVLAGLRKVQENRNSTFLAE